jgi:hypothetical protein
MSAASGIGLFRHRGFVCDVSSLQVPDFAGDTSNALFGAPRVFPANVSKDLFGTGQRLISALGVTI